MAIQIVLPFDQRVCGKCGNLLRKTNCSTCAKARYRSDSQFRAKKKEHARKWAARNPDKRKIICRKNREKSRVYNAEYKRQYKRTNRDKINATTRKHYWATVEGQRSKAAKSRERNRERRKDLNRAQYRKDIDKSRAIGRHNAALRKARLIFSSAGFSEQGWIQKCAYWGWCCYFCKTPLSFSTATVDHRIPIARGGPHVLSNTAPACHSCNCSKRHKTETEYRQVKQFPPRITSGISRSLPDGSESRP